MCQMSIHAFDVPAVADLYGEPLPLLRAGGVVLDVEQCLDQSEVRIVAALDQSQLTWSPSYTISPMVSASPLLVPPGFQLALITSISAWTWT